MQTLGSLIRSRRRELGLTLDRVASAVGCHKSYLSQIENERRPEGAQPSETLLTRLERSLRLPAGLLVRTARWQAMPAAVREEVRAMEVDRRAGRRLAALLKTMSLDAAHQSGELAALVSRLTGQGADAADALEGDANPRGAARSPEGESGDSRPGGSGGMEIVPLPLQAPLINSVRAGYPTEFTDLGYPARVADEYVSVPDLHDPDAFAARVVGDSMAPEYREGDVVVFSPERTARSGDDCFVRFERDAETTFKRVFFEGRREGEAGRRLEGDDAAGMDAGAPARTETDESSGEMIRLQPLNPRYAAQSLPREDVAGLYVAMWVIRATPRAGLPAER